MIKLQQIHKRPASQNSIRKQDRETRAGEIREIKAKLNTIQRSGSRPYYQTRCDLWNMLDSFSPVVSVREMHAITYSILNGGSSKKTELLCSRKQNPNDIIQYSIKDICELEEIIIEFRQQQEEAEVNGKPRSLKAYLTHKEVLHQKYCTCLDTKRLFDEIERQIKTS